MKSPEAITYRMARHLLLTGLILLTLLFSVPDAFAVDIIIVDDGSTTTDTTGASQGFWMNTPGRWDGNILANVNAQGGSHRLNDHNTPREVRWYPGPLAEAGYYEVSFRYIVPSSSPETALPVIVMYNNGLSATHTINQSSGGGAWIVLGSYYFQAGVNANQYVSFTKPGGTSTKASADAVKFVKVVGNSAPVANPESMTVLANAAAAILDGDATTILANDTDIDANPLTAILVSGVSHGSLTLNADGTFSYTHNGDAATSDSFTYKANDGTDDSNVATVNITIVHPVNSVSSHTNNEFASIPINLISSVPPQVMITSSNDHQLFFKAFNDYSDLDDDGAIDTTYKHSITYYGYFDSGKCYDYSAANQRFEPKAATDADNYCTGGNSGYWSGNFLNWASMARIDIIRKVLFGGHRRVDTAADTVLERTYLPHDAHSWAKHYDGADLEKLTPFARSVNYDCDQGDLAGCAGDARLRGITLCNTTDVNGAVFSENVTEPPLIKVVKGNHSLWAGNERWQCTWRSGADYDNHEASNGNDPASTGIYASSDNPTYANGIGEKDYVARVQVCVDGLLGNEKCKRYPNGNYKPVGLLQIYGDDNQMYFGMIAGTYNKHVSGGEVIRNIGSMSDEINVNTNGTFSNVAAWAGGSQDNNQAEGLINAWSLYRVTGYDHSDGTYNSTQGDNCIWGLSADFSASDAVMADNRCQNWGNPFAEIFLQSIRYFSNQGVAGVFRSSSSTGITGLPTPLPWTDPLNTTNYCARLNVINMNSSLLSFDSDELDATSYGVKTIWNNADLPGDKTSKAMTDVVGDGEGIHGSQYFVGEVPGSTDGLCTAKTVNSLGDALGQCPELPRMRGSYRIAGLAHYAKAKDIRPSLTGTQTIDFYAVAMASATPTLEIPHPTSNETAVTIMPACRNTSLNPDANCAIVDFKIVSQTSDPVSGVGSGKVYINWEDSEQGGDFDQDLWGTLEYEINANTNTISVTTQVHAQSTGDAMGFGYVISGTSQDGFHVHSGANGFSYTDPGGADCSASGGCKCRNDSNHAACTVATPTSRTYSLASSDASLLKDPLWYAAKWGNFFDSDGDGTPNITSEWDRINNLTGEPVADGIPDGYFYAANPAKLEEALNRVFLSILQRTSSGTAAAVVSNNVSGEGALYQAFYEPMRLDADGNEASWIGTVQALWLDSYGHLREDADGDAILDDYQTDKVIELYYDEVENRTRVKRFTSLDPDVFTPWFMAGEVTAYDADTQTATITVEEIYDGTGGDGPYSEWTVYNLTRDKEGASSTAMSIVAAGNSLNFTTTSDAGLQAGDQVLLTHYETTILELEDVAVLWNAREQLYFDVATDLALQRAFTLTADGGRHIKTWIDANADGVVAADEVVDFLRTEPLIGTYNELFDLPSEAEAKELVDYIRGKERPDFRSRTVDYDGNGEQVMRLGDIINSTPVVVTSPQERFDLLTNDASYRTFYRQYKNRRNVMYVGANDGMLHAINAGFFVLSYSMTGTVSAYNQTTGDLTLTIDENSGFTGDGPFTSWVVRNTDNNHSGNSATSLDIAGAGSTVNLTVSPAGDWIENGQEITITAHGDAPRFSTTGKKHDGSAAVAHPLGSELWAYVPFNLLSHLKWLKDPNYEHVYYMDGKPRIFDAKIFPKDAEHPGLDSDTKGWGTVMVVGMRFGGGPMTISVNGSNRTLRSALVIMDITNPEAEPRLLAEIQIPDGSFTTSSIEVMTFKKDPADENDSDDNKWYLMFGSGPLVDPHTIPNPRDDIKFAKRQSVASPSAKLYIMDLEQLFTPANPATQPPGCTVVTTSAAADAIRMYQCDTGVANAFVGGIGAVDWNNPLNYKADTVYFGLAGDANANAGRLMRLPVNENGDPASWGSVSTLIDTAQPLISVPTPALDNKGNKWLYFGTGRLYVSDDHSSTTSQSLYGVKDDYSGTAVAKANLFDSTGVQVYTSGNIKRDGVAIAGLPTLSSLESAIDANTYKGWHMTLPPIEGTAWVDPATRSLSESVLLGGVTFNTVYQPSTNPCSGEGFSRLYGLYYKTGTGYHSPTVFGTETEGEEELAITFMNLGRGFATTPALHSGAGLGGGKVEAFVQMSTGTITQVEAGMLTGNIRSGRESWREQ